MDRILSSIQDNGNPFRLAISRSEDTIRFSLNPDFALGIGNPVR
jgi:hypothetical protein